MSAQYRGSHWAPVTWRIRGLSWGRPFTSKMRRTAAELVPSAPRPYTVSVGTATSPPPRIKSAAVQAKDLVPAIVRAGGSTVGLRCPDHPLTLALLRAWGGALGGPAGKPAGSQRMINFITVNDQSAHRADDLPPP